MASRAAAERLLRRYHNDEYPTTDEEIDRALGIAAVERISLSDALRRHGHHRLFRQDIPYALVRDLYRRLSAAERSHILDLGSGYGRIGLYGALLFGNRYTGVEIVPERVEVAEAARLCLGGSGVTFWVGDALGMSWTQCSCVCLMNSFLPSLLPQALGRLRSHVASTGSIVAAVSTTAAALSSQSWLSEQIPQRCERAPSTSIRLFRPARSER